MAPPSKSKDSTNTRTRSKDTGDNNDNSSSRTKSDGLNRDKAGNLIDPPIIPEFERRMLDANNSGDALLIADVQEEYNDARVKLAREQADRERRRQEADR